MTDEQARGSTMQRAASHFADDICERMGVIPDEMPVARALLIEAYTLIARKSAQNGKR